MRRLQESKNKEDQFPVTVMKLWYLLCDCERADSTSEGQDGDPSVLSWSTPVEKKQKQKNGIYKILKSEKKLCIA